LQKFCKTEQPGKGPAKETTTEFRRYLNCVHYSFWTHRGDESSPAVPSVALLDGEKEIPELCDKEIVW